MRYNSKIIFSFYLLITGLMTQNTCYTMNDEKCGVGDTVARYSSEYLINEQHIVEREVIRQFLRENYNISQIIDITELIKKVSFDSIAHALIHRDEYEGFLDRVIGLNLQLRLENSNIDDFKNFVLALHQNIPCNIAFIEIINENLDHTPNDIIFDHMILPDIMYLRLKTGIRIKNKFVNSCLRSKKLINSFYQLIKYKDGFQEEEINELVKISCDDAVSSDGMPMRIEQALRTLLTINWGGINERYSYISDILRKTYTEQTVKSEVYHLNVDDILYFYMVKVTGKNAHMWKEYALKQRELSEKYIGEDYSIKKTDFGIKGFLPSIYYHDQDMTETWVAFVSNKSWENHNQLDYSSIEMFISMMTSKNARFTGHVGITRAVSYKGQKHQGLSCYLHGFLAQVTLIHYMGEKKYMINVPAARMREILLQKILEKEKISDVYIGDDHLEYPTEDLSHLIEKRKQMKLDKWDKSDIHFRTFEQNELFISLIQQKTALDSGVLTIPIRSEKISPNNYLLFKILDKEGRIINSLSPADMCGEFAWFFESPWFVKNSRHPLLTFDIQSLADLLNFGSRIEYKGVIEYIDQSPIV